MLGNNNCVQHNATQCCNQPSADTIVHWRNGWPGRYWRCIEWNTGWVMMMDNVALLCDKYRVHPNFWASPWQIFGMSPYYIDALYTRDLMLIPLIKLGSRMHIMCCIFVLNNWPVWWETHLRFLLQVIRRPLGNLPLHKYVVHSLSLGRVAIPDWSQAKGDTHASVK